MPFLEAYSKALGNNEYYEQVLRVITMLDDPEIRAKRLNGQLWYEIDDIQDLDIASSIFTVDESEKLSNIQRRFGGYWRYPHMLDYCYLVNPYYPPQKLIDEIKASFEVLMTSYPSGMAVNSLIAGRNFGIDQEYIVVGNGASELIKSLMTEISGPVGFVRPTFEEYPNRYDPKNSVAFYPNTDDFSYTAQDLEEFFSGKDIGAIVLINPDNPSGNYLPKSDVMKLAAWSEENQVRLIVDESFSDFAEEPNNSLFNDSILEKYKNLIVVKSISKSFGVPGLRLGVLASADSELIERTKRDVAIWNINSFAEFYLQIAEKYRKDYDSAMERFREERRTFIRELTAIPGIKVLPTQANYVMVRLCCGKTASEITQEMLSSHRMLIKDLTGKIPRERGEFIRLAIRNREDNRKLIDALRTVTEL